MVPETHTYPGASNSTRSVLFTYLRPRAGTAYLLGALWIGLFLPYSLRRCTGLILIAVQWGKSALPF